LSKAAPIHWLSALAKFQGAEVEAPEDNVQLLLQIERLEENLDTLGALHEGRLAKLEKKILTGLHSLSPDDSTPFETAHVELGKLLGFSAGIVQIEGSPDPWWLLKNYLCFVFEDHAGGKTDGCLNTSKARQAMAHPDWIRANIPDSAGGEIFSVVVTPATRADQGAKSILHHFYVWPLNEFIPWAEKAISVVRTIRGRFPGSGDLVWRAEAMDLLKAERLDPSSIKELVCVRSAEILSELILAPQSLNPFQQPRLLPVPPRLVDKAVAGSTGSAAGSSRGTGAPGCGHSLRSLLIAGGTEADTKTLGRLFFLSLKNCV
jgi:hypothetical protein